MKRPLVWVGVFILLGILIAQFLSPKSCLLLWGAGAILLFSFCSHHKFQNFRYLFYYLFFLLGIVLFIAYQSEEERTIRNLYETSNHKMIIKDITASHYRCLLTQSGWFHFYIELPIDKVNESLQISDHINVCGNYIEFRKPENDGAFDYKRYKELKGILGEVLPNTIEITQKGDGTQRWIPGIRRQLTTTFRNYLVDGPNGLMVAFFTGNRDEIPEQDKELFQTFGVSHILSISGMHIAVFSGLLGFILGRRFRKKYANVLSFGFLLGFGMLCGFSVSIIRVMGSFLLGSIAGFMERRKDSITSLSIVVIILILRRPIVFMDTGFMLSFGAAFAYFVLLPCTHRIRKQENGGHVVRTEKKYLFSDALFLQLFLMPIVLCSNYSFSPYSFLINVLILPFLPIVLFCGIVLLLFSSLFPILSIGCAFIISGFYFGVIFLLQSISKLPVSVIVTGKPTILGVLAFYCIYVILMIRSYYGGRSLVRNFIQIAAVVFLFSLHRGCEIYNLAVGQGDCSVILNNHHAVVIDCGSAGDNEPGNRILTNFLRFHGISKIDYVILSHNDKDHVSGITEISERIPVGNLICTEEPSEHRLNNLFQEKGCICRKGDEFTWQGLEFSCLWPETERFEGTEDKNNESLVFLVSWNYGNALFTGDVGTGALESIVQSDSNGRIKSIDYFKVPHHGSKNSYSRNAYMYLKPRKCVISVGLNNIYGHPADIVVEGLLNQNAILHRTDIDGQSVYQIHVKQ